MPSDRDDETTDLDREELARLRAENARLQSALQGQPVAPAVARPSRQGVWRPIVATVLIILAAILAPLAVVATWAKDEVGDTERYVETVGPLATDPAVQDAISDRITTEIFNRLDVEALTQQAVDVLAERGLPPTAAAGLDALATPLANGVKSFVSDKVHALVKTPEFEQAWEEANRQAHTQLVAILTGDTSKAVQFDGKSVTVNLATVIDAVKGKLADSGFGLASKLPEINAQFTIVQSVDITKAQRLFRLLEALSVVLPVLALALLAGAIGIGRSRRRTLIAGALAVAASMLILGLALNVFRGVYLNGIPPDVLPANAAGVIYDQLVYFIRLNLRALLVLFLAIAAIAWVTGPGPGPVAIRGGSTKAIDAVRNTGEGAGISTGRFGTAVYQMRTALQAVILGGALLLYVLRDHPTGKFTIILLVVALLLLLVVELLGRPPRTVAAESEGARTDV